MVTKSLFLLCFGVATLIQGCGYESRISQLERDVRELKQQSRESQAATQLDLQAKCSRDAKIWFGQNWSRDKRTIVLEFTSHYNRAQGKCFGLVRENSSIGAGRSWASYSSLFDVYENVKYAEFNQMHMVTVQKSGPETSESVATCEVLNKKCSTPDEFTALVQPYMGD
jgi:hypothetical protein